MAERKAISKKTRFEVFKRDSFKCQYCGRSAPDVILNVDHILPVSRGGKNVIMNLITACFACNNGKGARELSDNAAISKQKSQLDELAQKREQLGMLVEWRESLIDAMDQEVRLIKIEFEKYTECELTEHGIASMRGMIKQFGYDEVVLAISIAAGKFRDRNKAQIINYIAGICWNRKRSATE
jgi:hypothetical protein